MAGIMDQKIAGSPNSIPQKTMISIESFLLGLKIPFDVYTRDSRDSSGFSCILKKWTKFDQDIKNALKSKGIMFLYVEGEPLKIKEFFNEKPAGADKHDSYLKNKESYHHVSKLIFNVGAKVNFSIFNVVNMDFMPLIETVPDRPVLITDAVRKADGDLAVKLSDIKLFREFLSGLSKNSASSPQAKAAGIKEDTKMSVRDFLADPGNSQNTEGVVNSANQIVSVLKSKEAGFSDLLTLRSRDFHIYTHCSNVAVLSTAMAVAMGIEQKKIEALAIGAIMHDVGKGTLPSTVLYKKDRLTDEEFALWKKHVSDGVSILRNKGLPADSLSAVQQHHERLSGRGYQLGLKGNSVNLFGKIMSIVDCYDLLTTPRPFKHAQSPFNALNIIMKEASDKGDFDIELVRLLVKILKGQGRV